MAKHKLLSGRVKTTPAANVTADRYDFLGLEQAEPNLGTAAQDGYVLIYDSNAPGKRNWSSSSLLSGGITAQSAFESANSASSYANSAFIVSNSAAIYANSAFVSANSASSYANGAFITANSASNYANASFETANSAGVYANAAFDKANSANILAQASFNTANLKFNTSGGTISGDVTITGNLTIEGNTVIVNVSTLAVEDSIIQLARNNTSDAVDIGFLGHYDAGSGNVHAGLIRRASDDTFYLFDNLTTETLTNVVDVANSSIATLRANLISNNVLIRGYDPVNHTNNAYQVANSGSSYANGAFAAANTADQRAVTSGTYANAAFVVANSASSYANGAFGAANVADQKAVTSGDYANSAFLAANTADQKAVSAGSYANSAFGVANSASSYANGAFTAANTADQKAVTSGLYANSAYIHANAAFNAANAASSYANGAFAAANTADQRAVTSGSYANSAYQTANSGSSYANGAFAAANTADQRAVTSGIYANSAFAAANSNYTSAVTRLTVTNSGASAFLIDQYTGNNPTIYVSAGETIAFQLSGITGHPFMIRVSSGGSNYDTGLTHVSTTGTVSTDSSAQAKESGTLYWKVPFDLVGLTYVYQCQAHSGMVGSIVIQQPASFVASNTQLAFTAANTADQRAVTSGSYANSSYIHANAAFNAANSATDTWVRNAANAASSYANSAYAQANTGTTLAQAAFDQANTGGGAGTDSYARNTANAASSYANSAYLHANAAFNAANTGGAATDSFARTQANAAFNQANSAASGGQTIYVAAIDTFTSNGQNTTFTLSTTPTSANQIMVYIDGVYQQSSGYTLSGATLTMSEAVDANSSLQVRTFANTATSQLGVTIDTFTGTGACTTFTLSTVPTSKNLTSVIVGGVPQLKSAYSITGTSLVFTGAPANNSVIEVATYKGGGSYATSFTAVVDKFTGNGAQTTFGLSTIPNSENETFVYLNGVYQNKDTYSVSGANVVLTGTATSNDTIEVVTVAGSEMNVTSSRYNSRVYTGTGACTQFTISSSHSANSVLVFENGICQEPITDYTVSGTTLTFTTAPGNGFKIQIRELPV